MLQVRLVFVSREASADVNHGCLSSSFVGMETLSAVEHYPSADSSRIICVFAVTSVESELQIRHQTVA